MADVSMNGQSILVIDSGVGGLSICQSILAVDHPLQLIYFADDAFFPYGLLDEIQLTRRLCAIVGAMLQRHQPDLVVLACNTVSTLLLPELRARFEVPFVGVVPAIKPAALLSNTKRLGLLATPATVRRPYTDELIANFAADCEVLRVGSNDLVLQAENLLHGRSVCMATIGAALQPFVAQSGQTPIDTIVLGCTHFPLLVKQFAQLLPMVTWVDSGAAVARRVHSLLEVSKPERKYPEPVQHQVYFSRALPDTKVFHAALAALGFGKCHLKLLAL